MMSKLINLTQKINCCLLEKSYWKKQITFSQYNEELGVLRDKTTDKRQNLTSKRNYALLEDKPST